jgi:hypothetical protein
MALADEADDYGYCFPSHRRLATKCSIGERTVRRILGELERAGYLRVEARYRADRSQTSNGYRLASKDPPAKMTRGQGSHDHGPATRMARGEGSDVQPLPINYPLTSPPLRQWEPSSETKIGQASDAPSGCDWEYLKNLSASQIEGLRGVIEGIDLCAMQQVLDELAGRLRAGGVTNPIGYCAALVDRVKRHQFAPQLGLRIADLRAARQQYRERLAAASTADPAASEGALGRLPDRLRRPLERAQKRLREPPSNKQECDRVDAKSDHTALG